MRPQPYPTTVLVHEHERYLEALVIGPLLEKGPVPPRCPLTKSVGRRLSMPQARPASDEPAGVRQVLELQQ